MNIDFKDKKLREFCEKQGIAERKLGVPCARKLRSRLADLLAAPCVTALVAGRPHSLKGDRVGEFALDLEGGIRLVFEPDEAPIPAREEGATDWSRVTQVRIVFIGDYHE